MPKKLPKNFPISQTGTQLFDWICEGEKKYNFVYPDDYIVNGAPATDVLDTTQTYFLDVEPAAPSTGFIHEFPGGPLVEAVQTTDPVASRLGAGGNITDDQISTMVDVWYDANNFPPPSKLKLDIRYLISDTKVDY